METPRRNRLDLNEPSELAIYNAMQEVEKMGADVRLTKAVTILQEAKNLVADFIDSIDDPDGGQMNPIIYVYWRDGRIEEMSRRRWRYQNIAFNPSLYFWSNKSSDPDYSFINGEWTYVGEKDNGGPWCESCGGRNCIC